MQNTFKGNKEPKQNGILKLNPPVFEDAVQATRERYNNRNGNKFNRLMADIVRVK